MWAICDLASHPLAMVRLQAFLSGCPIGGGAHWQQRIPGRWGEHEGQPFLLSHIDINQQTCVGHSFYSMHIIKGH